MKPNHKKEPHIFLGVCCFFWFDPIKQTPVVTSPHSLQFRQGQEFRRGDLSFFFEFGGSFLGG